VVIAVSEEAITVGVVIAEAATVAKAVLSASVIIALAD
jgi:putative ubiquitin-RnfH superfamily antitoxin RatB of RatAB toxin-antitoxin module